MKIKIECTAEEFREFLGKSFFGNEKKIFIPEDGNTKRVPAQLVTGRPASTSPQHPDLAATSDIVE